MRKAFVGIGAVSCCVLVFFLAPRLPGDFLRLAQSTFFPREEVIAEIPLQGEREVQLPMAVELPRSVSKPSYPKLFMSEVMAGSSASAQDEFVELYNPNDVMVPLADWSITRKSATGKESSFVSASRLKDKIIPPHRYFLLAHDGGYANRKVVPDAFWPKSYSLGAGSGSLVLYDPAGNVADMIAWKSIPKNQSIARASWNPDSAFVPLPVPTPQNSHGASN